MATRKRTKTAKTAMERLEAELPKTLREYSKSVRRELTRIERDVEKATASARRRGVRLLREASHELGRLEERGEKAWKRLTVPYRRRAVETLKALEKAVAPAAKARKKATRKRTAKRKVSKRKTTKRKASRARA